MVQSALDGYKVAIFAYGQTGGGKTYTMEGDRDGVIPRAVDLIFREVDELREKGWHFSIKMSCLEVYNEIIYDLLAPKGQEAVRTAFGTDARPVKDFTSRGVHDALAVHRLLLKAKRERHTASTACNDRSSRSHAIFQPLGPFLKLLKAT